MTGVQTCALPIFGYRDCLDALRPHWDRARRDAEAANRASSRVRRGVGLAGMWYGCGNTALPNPSTVRIGVSAAGRVVLFQGAVDMGQGPNTVMQQIAADALGVDFRSIDLRGPDTDTTPDAGKSSASRQTFVTGNATMLAARELAAKLRELAGASDDARLELDGTTLVATDRGVASRVDLAALPADAEGLVVVAEASYDPPTTTLDAQGQGEPYAQFGYGAHLVELEVDLDLGTVRLLRLTAAHDVGRAVNPGLDRKSTRLNSSHSQQSRMPSSA